MFNPFKSTLFVACLLIFFSVGKAEGNLFASSIVFREIWGYLKEGEETHFPANSPITDVAYFCAQVNEEGRLSKVPSVEKLPPACKSLRKHLVIAVLQNKWLMHWVLKKDLKSRDTLVADIVKASSKYDGIHIDFETLRPEDKEPFIVFLKRLKNKLAKEKVLSVALPARTRDRPDAYSYKQIGQVVDRVVVMAYDEHWAGGKAGPIASGGWCERVASYAVEQMPLKKLILGLPLYGRVWQTTEVACSLKHNNIQRLIEKHKASIIRTSDAVPSFSFEEKVKAICYFEDIQSLEYKLKLYQGKNIDKVAFWRLSQEPAKLWQIFKASNDKTVEEKRLKIAIKTK